jgi:predicted metalloendopeptidase
MASLLVRCRRLGAGLLFAALSAACDGDDVTTRSGLDLGSLDRSVDPCADFYQFACGGWVRSHPLASDAWAVNRFQEPFYAAVPALREIVEGDANGATSSDDPYAHLIGDWYAACLAAPTDMSSRAQLRVLVQAIDAVTTLEELAVQSVAQRALGSGTFFSTGVEVDPGDSSRHLARVDQGGVELGDRSYYLDADQADVRADYKSHIAALSALVLGRSIDADAVIRVETALATAFLPRDAFRDPASLYHPMSTVDLAALTPSFPWSTFWDALGVAPLDRIDVAEPDYFTALDDVFASTPIPDLVTYMKWQLIQDRSADLDQGILDEDFAFWSSFTGQQSPHDRPWTCFLRTLSTLPQAVAQPFLARSFDESARAIADDSSRALVDAFFERITEASWLDATTRTEALAKLDTVTFKLGYPAHWVSYDGLAFDKASYFNNHSALIAHRTEESWADLGTPVDKAEWSLSPLDVNAAYSPSFNDVTLTALWLSPPFVVVGAPIPRNAGSMASVVGHELTHGFDDWGRHYDGKGNLRDWWSDAAEANFRARAHCVIEQFDGYEAVPGEFVNGELTVGENIADLGGIAMAYRALVEASGVGDGGDGFDANQVFFIAYAQDHCENVRPEWMSSRLLSDPHAPPRFRVNGPLANLSEFAQAFQCGPGSPMVRANPCRVW